MVATLHSDLLAQATKHFRYGDVEMRDWFRDKAMDTLDVSANKVIESAHRSNIKSRVQPGKMFLY